VLWAHGVVASQCIQAESSESEWCREPVQALPLRSPAPMAGTERRARRALQTQGGKATFTTRQARFGLQRDVRAVDVGASSTAPASWVGPRGELACSTDPGQAVARPGRSP
jgi:hypothetical protein